MKQSRSKSSWKDNKNEGEENCINCFKW